MYKTIRTGQVQLLALAAALLAGLFAAAAGQYIPAGGDLKGERPVIVLDAGHGGVDPGAIGTNGALEKDINLSIALCLRDILEANGFTVVMIREEDVSVNDARYKKISQIKTSDLKNRLKTIEDYPDAIAVSIHQNHFSQEKSSGAQMFYGRKNPESEPLAQAIQASFRERLQPDNSRAVKQSTSDVYILHNASIPIVLVECGFLSNREECALLCDEEYQRQAAFAIFCGIAEYREEVCGS